MPRGSFLPPSGNSNSAQMDTLMGPGAPSAAPVAPPAPVGMGDMIPISMPRAMAEQFMDLIGQQLEAAGPPQAAAGAPPPSDEDTPGAGAEADEDQIEGE